MQRYYAIIRHVYGFPNYLDENLSYNEDCFLFKTEEEANYCLKLCFNNGDWMYDERYGKVRYYVEVQYERI